MAKLNRSSLKVLVKECLVEILAEGLADSTSMMTESAPRRRPKRTRTKKEVLPNRPALDTVRFDDAVETSVQTLTEDPLMSSIFADTARTTLQEQVAEEGRSAHNAQINVHGDDAARVAAASDPMDTFGEASSNWAALAFDK